MSRTRVHSLHMSLDGYSAGTTITLESPMGGAEKLFGNFDGRVIDGVHQVPDDITPDRALYSLWGQGIGVEIMGRRKFGVETGPWTDDTWRGWWDDDPPFRTPVIVLTHHAREPIVFDNGTTFHFVDATPHDALSLAHDLAPGLDVRIGGGPSTVAQFLQADLVDFLHLITVPVVLGSGVSVWPDLAGVQDRFTIETVSTRALTHQFWNRKH